MSKATLSALFIGFANLFTVKTQAENGPSMDGRIKAEGAAEDDNGIRIAAFAKTGKESGREYLSLSIGDKENRLYGSLFANDKKEAANQADHTGSIDLPEGKKLYLAGWNKTDKNGSPYISLKVSPPMAKAESEAAPAPAEAAA